MIQYSYVGEQGKCKKTAKAASFTPKFNLHELKKKTTLVRSICYYST
jgi:hypothetical protein